MEYGWQRRQAVQIAAMLPEDTENARLVLRLAMELVNGFLAGQTHLSESPPSCRTSGVDLNFVTISNGKALSSP